MVSHTADSGTVPARSVVALFAPTVGWDRSVEAVAATIRRLRLDEGALGPRDVAAVLEDLAVEQGIVGVTARIVLSRSTHVRTEDSTPAPPSSTRPLPSIRPPPASDTSPASVLVMTIGVHEVVAQLAPLLGVDKTEAAVNASQRKLGLPRERLDREQVGRLLDELGHQDGPVGMTVRFARGRVMARFGG
jgi:hypothetical protein